MNSRARIYTYTYEIKPRISLEASAGGEPIAQEFIPTLTIKFDGGKIQIEGLRSTKAGSVTHLETEAATWGFLGLATQVRTMKVASIIASISLAALLAVSMRFTLQERTSRPLLDRLGARESSRCFRITINLPLPGTLTPRIITESEFSFFLLSLLLHESFL